MTSKLVVNTIEADTGISSVSFASSISLSSTSKFFFSDAGIDIGADTNINRPATGVIGFNINSGEKVRITSNGNILVGKTADAGKGLEIYQNANAALRIQNSSTGQGAADGLLIETSGSDALIWNYENAAIRFGTNNGERVRITSSGDTELRNNVAGINDAYSQYLKFRTTQSNGQSAITGAIRAQGKSNWGGELAFYSKPANGSPNDTVTENLRITSSGILLLGTSTQTNNIRLGNKFGIAGTTAYTGMSISNYAGTAASAGPMVDFNRSRGTSDGSLTTVAANDKLGELIFRGSNGSAFADAVTLRGYAGTVSGSNVNGVYEISTSNAGSMTVRLRVDENGYVTTPANPKFWAKSSNAQTLNSNSANIIKNYENEIYDIGSCYDGTNKFTAPITGYYHFGWSFMIQGGNANTFTYLFGAPLISGNDIQQEVMAPRSGGANYQSVVGSHLLYLTSGQYVQIRMRQSGGSNVSVRADQSYFWGYLVS